MRLALNLTGDSPSSYPDPAQVHHSQLGDRRCVVRKFVDGLPFYRQEVIYNRDHIELSRPTMSGWVMQLHERLTPLLALSIPVTLLLVVGGLCAFAQTLNLLTLGALAIAVGRLLDDTTIVLEARLPSL